MAYCIPLLCSVKSRGGGQWLLPSPLNHQSFLKSTYNIKYFNIMVFILVDWDQLNKTLGIVAINS